ncbi:MAG: hypothetical protein HC833_15145 [Leptolyngbyaceae cyanobacterium RM1_406_9]|nr:hypothetical protein [Leptolyngbyaceae cyanobacterium RM1_406_9]
MTYQEHLSPWVIHQLLPDCQQQAIARFRHRNDAEGYLKAMTQMRPSSKFAIAFDVNVPEGNSKTQAATSNPKSNKNSTRSKAKTAAPK